MLHEVDRNTMAPCPFCGQQGDYYIGETENRWIVTEMYQYQVECADCSATVYGDICKTEQEAYDSAILEWNTRVN